MNTLDETRPASTRVSVARLAEGVLARSEGVGATRGRGRWFTADGERSIDGIVVAETAAGRIDVDLHLDAEWPARPLPALADQIRWELNAEAVKAGLGTRIGEIDISVHDFKTSEELEREAAGETR
jgi:uncharacterized alkaline shock family protein YloU